VLDGVCDNRGQRESKLVKGSYGLEGRSPGHEGKSTNKNIMNCGMLPVMDCKCTARDDRDFGMVSRLDGA